MPAPSVTYSFSNGTTADASQVNSNFTDLINSLTDGLKTLTISVISVGSTSTFTGLITANGGISIGTGTALTITKTTNQFVLGTTNTVTISSIAQAASRVFTIPVVAGTSDFVMTAAGTTDTILGTVIKSSLTTLGTITTGVWNAGAVTSSGSFTGTNVLFSGTSPIIRLSTTDGADNGTLQVWGGGAGDVAQGAGVVLFGNESAGTGKLKLYSGNVTGGDMEFYTGNAVLALSLAGTSGNATLSARLAGSSSMNRGLGTATDAAQTATYFIESGSYTPTRSAEVNCTGNASSLSMFWMRVCNTVTVTGEFTVTGNTATTLTQVSMTIPIASEFSSNTEGGGTMWRRGAGTNLGSIDVSNATNGVVASWILNAGDAGASRTYGFSFTYSIVA